VPDSPDAAKRNLMLDHLGKFINSSTLAIAGLLEREAGYFIISLGLIAVGVCLVDRSTRGQVAHDLVVFGTGVLARSMGVKKATTPTP
jgi:hypothetical protein